MQGAFGSNQQADQAVELGTYDITDFVRAAAV